tara:strand:- start:13414 stop:13572 length:159 start_codon:yes stop_codon:yes gene_type:complete
MVKSEDRLQLVIKSDLRDRVDAWRRAQSHDMNMSAAIRRLIVEGLKHGSFGD